MLIQTESNGKVFIINFDNSLDANTLSRLNKLFNGITVNYPVKVSETTIHEWSIHQETQAQTYNRIRMDVSEKPELNLMEPSDLVVCRDWKTGKEVISFPVASRML